MLLIDVSSSRSLFPRTPFWRTLMNDETERDTKEEAGLSLLQLISSIIAAAFGVQSSANRKRDFSRGKSSQFIIVGILFTVVFVVLLISFVNLVLRNVG